MARSNGRITEPVPPSANDSDIHFTSPDAGSAGGDHGPGDKADTTPADELAGRTEASSRAADGRATRRKRAVLQRAAAIRPADHADAGQLFAGSYPELAEYLCLGTWDDIQPRDAGTLKVRCKAGVVYGTLSLPTEGQEITLGGLTLDGLLLSLDDACRTGKGPWQDMRWGTGVQKKRDLRKKEADKRKFTEYPDALGGDRAGQ